MFLNSEIWEHFVYLSNNQVFSDGPENYRNILLRVDLSHALQQCLIYSMKQIQELLWKLQ
jgi:hypothetical protein